MFYNDPKTANLVISVSIARRLQSVGAAYIKAFLPHSDRTKEQREYNNFVSEGKYFSSFLFYKTAESNLL